MSVSNGYVLTMKGIYKGFPGVQALEDVDFSVCRGEIHALMGENGAGKSTLIKVLTGVEHPDAGTIVFAGKEIHVRSPQHAQQLGISTVYQEINLCPNLSVAENVLIGQEPRKFGVIDWKTMNGRAQQILHRLDIDIDVTQTLGSYPVAIQQMVAIARALEISSTRLLILDEPTSSLDVHETRKLFQVMRKLKSEGVAIIFITHFLDQVYEVTDRITVLRNGRLVGTYNTDALSRLELIANMLGRALTDLNSLAQTKLAEVKDASVVLQAQQLGHNGSIEPFDLTLRAGEVVGLAGLLGSGRTESANLLFGIDHPDHGTLIYKDEPVHHFSPLSSILRGIVLCPEDRKANGIVDDLSIRENIILALQASRGLFHYLSPQKQYEITEEYIRLLNIATPSADQAVKNLSGGNQQKVILARWLATNPQVLILDEPTRGIDVGAKAEIQKLVLELAEKGMACVFISSELEEVARCCQRVAVLRDKQKVTELSGAAINENRILEIIAGGE